MKKTSETKRKDAREAAATCASLTRRDFCNLVGAASAAVMVAGVTSAKAQGERERRPRESVPMRVECAERMERGSAHTFRYPTERDTAIIIRTTDGEYYAFTQKCTHISCPIAFEPRNGRLECPCHAGAFDARTGRVLHGPPRSALDRIIIEVRPGGEVWAVGRQPGGEER